MTGNVTSLLDPPQEWFASTSSTSVSESTLSKKKATQQAVPSHEMISPLNTGPMCDAQTQTEKQCNDKECQTTGPDVVVNSVAVGRDHTYAKKPSQTSDVVSVVPPEPIPETQPQQHQSKSPPSETEPESSLHSSDHETGEIDDVQKDPTYSPDKEDDQDDDDELPEERPFWNRTVEDCKYLVFSSCLDKLFYKIKCDECYCNVESIKRSVVGTGLFVTLQCISGHEVMKWVSQPLVGKMPVGNLLTAASITYSGLTYQRMASFANFLNLKIFSHTIFFNIQRDYLIPEVNSTWLKEQSSLISSLQGKPISIVGDGRCDSPGYSAKYCSYTLMDIESEKVIDFELVQVSETGSSVKMEAVGFKRCFSRVLDDHKLNVDKFASDRHVSIRKIMKDNYKDVKHNFDVFHLAKNISSKLRKIAKKKDNEDIECWIKSINNHVWWCSRNCEKDPSIYIFASTSSGSTIASPLIKKKLIQQTGSHQMTGNVTSLLDPPQEWFASTSSTSVSESTLSKKKATQQAVPSHEMISPLNTGPMCDAQTQTEKQCNDKECQTTGPDVVVNSVAVGRDHTYAKKPSQTSDVVSVVPPEPIPENTTTTAPV
ncbi:hypothetical protein HOLleu_44465 [Holothuria leucospilota]|uniref:Transposase n=1 Tax=Holothuria leucospilota TaxID=206669 RepID=A0A9Q1BAG2_HOLLE|nr:hypothetical protein HOLleu_44465 [Holothuria leucospilota]